MKNDQKGATAVEFAVIVALLLIILFAILEFGFLFMQEHYIANAAREGVRIGVRANNFNCFESASDDTCKDVKPADRVFRMSFVENSLRGTATSDGYLSTLYGRNNPDVIVVVGREPDDADPANTQKTLNVTVTAPNIFPPILSSLVKLIPGTDFELPSTISYTAEGDYEDPSEP